MKMLIELWLDGYNTSEEHREACLAFVKEQLNMTASGISILWAEGEQTKKGALMKLSDVVRGVEEKGIDECDCDDSSCNCSNILS